MAKVKIAISIDKNLLDRIDSKVDNFVIRSRSQAIEYFLLQGLKEQSIDTAVILLRGEHQKIALRVLKNKSLLRSQIEFFEENGIRNVYIVTQYTKNMNLLLGEISDSKMNVKVARADAKGNAQALLAVKEMLGQGFIVMSGDTYHGFDLKKMIKKHLDEGKTATIALMTRDKPSEYGAVVLDGDSIITFEEKPKKAESHVVNAGFYLFDKKVFSFFGNKTISLEKDLFPKLAEKNQLVGFFTHGIYEHFE